MRALAIARTHEPVREMIGGRNWVGWEVDEHIVVGVGEQYGPWLWLAYKQEQYMKDRGVYCKN